MSFEDIKSLTVLTKECFSGEDQPLESVIGIVAQIQTLLNIDPHHNVFLSAKINAGPNVLMLDVGLANYPDAESGTLVQKQYDVKLDGTSLRVTPIHSDVDDLPSDNASPRRLHSYEFFDAPMSVELLTATLITDIKEFMTAEDQAKLASNPEFQASNLPIAAAFWSVLSAKIAPETRANDLQ